MADIQPRFPGPSSVVGAASRLVAWEIRVARYVLSIPARIALLLEDAEMLLVRINAIANNVDRAVAAVDQIILAAADSVDGVDQTIARVGRAVSRAELAIGAAEGIVGRVDAVTGSAEGLVLRVDSAVTDAEGLVLRVALATGDAEQLVRRIGTSVDDAEELVLRVDSTVDSADGLVLRIDSATGAAEALVTRVHSTVGDAEQIVERTAPLLEFVETTVAGVRPVLEELLLEEGVRAEQAKYMAGRVTELLTVADEMATKLVPIVGRVADTVDSDDFEAVLDVIDNLPTIVNAVEKEVLPVIRSLDTVGPELSEILEVANNCLEALNGIPGFQRLRRRGGDGTKGLT